MIPFIMYKNRNFKWQKNIFKSKKFDYDYYIQNLLNGIEIIKIKILFRASTKYFKYRIKEQKLQTSLKAEELN